MATRIISLVKSTAGRGSRPRHDFQSLAHVAESATTPEDGACLRSSAEPSVAHHVARGLRILTWAAASWQRPTARNAANATALNTGDIILNYREDSR